jgi:hypothetical protein
MGLSTVVVQLPSEEMALIFRSVFVMSCNAASVAVIVTVISRSSHGTRATPARTLYHA